MKTLNSEITFKEIQNSSREKLVPSVAKDTVENATDYYDEPGYFFRGAVFGFIFCVPFWAAIFWLIS